MEENVAEYDPKNGNKLKIERSGQTFSLEG
jgi:hypothetical protein